MEENNQNSNSTPPVPPVAQTPPIQTPPVSNPSNLQRQGLSLPKIPGCMIAEPANGWCQ